MFKLKTKRYIWTFYLLGLMFFSLVLFFGFLSIDIIAFSRKIQLFIYTLGITTIVTKNIIDIYLGEGSFAKNIQDIIITTAGFSFMYGAGILFYVFFF